MDSEKLVDRQIVDGERLVNRLLEDGVDVSSAYWSKSEETNRWNLTIATKLVKEYGPNETYRRILTSLNALGESWLSSSHIRAVGFDAEKTRQLFEERIPGYRHFPASAKPNIDGFAGEDLYVYRSGIGAPQRSRLSEDQKQILAKCFFSHGSNSVDDLPYSAEMESIAKEFNRQTNLGLDVRDVYKSLINLRKQGRLANRLRDSLPAA